MVFLISAYRLVNKVLICKYFSNSGVHPNRGHNVMSRQTFDPGEQAMTPKIRYTDTIFIDSDLVYSYQGK